MADAPRFSVSGDQIVDAATGKPVPPNVFNSLSTPEEKSMIGRELTARSLLTNQEGEGGSASVDEDLPASSSDTVSPAPDASATPSQIPLNTPPVAQSVPSERPVGTPPPLNDFLQAARQVNPEFDDREIAVEYRRLYPEASKFYPSPPIEPWVAKAKEANPEFDESELKSYYTDIYGAPEVRADHGDVVRGFIESVKQIPQLAYGLTAGAGAVGEKLFGEGGGATALKQFGVENYQRIEADLAKDAKLTDSLNSSYEQAKQGDYGALVDWLQHGFGYVGGQAMQLLATGAIGGVVGKAALQTTAETVAKNMVAKETATLAAQSAGRLSAEELAKAAVANVAKTMGQTLAVGATAVGMEGGEIFGDLTSDAARQGRQLSGSELAKAGVMTAFAGALEFAGDKIGLDLILGKSPITKMLGPATGVGGRLARGAEAGAIAAVPEAATEFGQTIAEEWGKGHDPIGSVSPETLRQAQDAAGIGALGGALVGGTAGAMRPGGGKEPPPVEDLVPTSPTPPVIAVAPILQATSVDEAISNAAKLVEAAPITPEQLDRTIGVPQTLTPVAYGDSHLAADQVAFRRMLAQGGTGAVSEDATTGQATYEGSSIRVVDPRTLPATTPPEAGLSQEKFDALSVMAQAFGKRIVVFESGKSLPQGAFWQAGDPSRIYLEETSSHEDAFTVFAHEAMHTMQGTPFYEAYKRTIYESRTPEAKALLKARHGEHLSDTQLLEEAAADIGSTELQKPEMWEKVFANLRAQVGDEQAKVETVSFIDSLKQIIQRIKSLISTRSITLAQKTMTELYVKDLEKVQDALAEAVGKTLYEKRFATPEQAKAVGKLTLAKRSTLDRTLLPRDVAETFSNTAQAQRGAPEEAMRAVQKAAGGGLMSSAVERAGDLLHRMTEGARTGTSGRATVKEKVDALLTSLTHAYGFEKEHGENLVANKADQKAVAEALNTYAQTHRALPVYNRAQWLARATATALGEMRVADAVEHLKLLKKMADSADFGKEAFTHARNADQSLRPYLQPIPGKLIGIQRTGSLKIPDFEMYNIDVDIPGHPKDSTVTQQTMAEEGYRIVPNDLVNAQELKAQQKEAAKKTLEAAKKPEKATPAPATAGAVLNIGLNVNDGSTISAQTALSALKLAGAKVLSHSVRTSNTEPTLIAEIETPLSAEKATALSATLKQDAIAQRLADGTGALYGPQAEKWGPFNPEYFLSPDEKPALSPKPTSGDALGRLEKALKTTTSPGQTKFLLPDGTRLTWPEDQANNSNHEALARRAGVWLDEVIRDGGIRYVPHFGIDVGKSITTKQAEAIIDDWYGFNGDTLQVDVKDSYGSVIAAHEFDVVNEELSPTFLQDWIQHKLDGTEMPRFSPKSTAKLTHYSAQKNLTEIDPSFHGTGQIGAESRRQMNEGKAYIPRSFFYRAGTKIEPRFKGMTKYTVEVPESSLVDLSTLTGTPTERELAAKKQGYKGFYNSESSMPNVVAMFEPVAMGEDVGPRFSPKIWFSGLGNMLSEKMPAKASVEQVRNLLKSPGVKQDEVKWTGIQDYLDRQTGPVDKHNLLAWLAAHNIEIEEVTLGGTSTAESSVRQLPLQTFVEGWVPGERDPASAEDIYVNSEFPNATITNTDGTSYYHVHIGDQFLAGDAFSLDDESASTNAFNSMNSATEAAYEYLVAQPNRDESWETRTPQTRYEGYKEPGGTDYTELLLTWKTPLEPVDRAKIRARFQQLVDIEEGGRGLPPRRDLTQEEMEERDRLQEELNQYSNPHLGKAAKFQSAHFDEPDILAHVRFDMRTDAEGKNVLFLEEVQSDWHEQGREKGYQTPKVYVVKAKGSGNFITVKATRAEAEKAAEEFSGIVEEQDRQSGDTVGVSDAPFSKTWPELVMKRMLRYAAEHNVDRLAWTTGAMQNARYGLSKHIDSLEVRLSKLSMGVQKTSVYEIIGRQNNQIRVRKAGLSESELADTIGKDLAQRAIEQVKRSDFLQTTLTGVDLEIGGSGMKYFYDQMLPKFLEKYLKRFGTKVGTTTIETGVTQQFTYEGPVYTAEELTRGLAEIRSGQGDRYESPFTHKREDAPINTVTYEQQLRDLVAGVQAGLSFHRAFAQSGSFGLATILGGDQVRVEFPTEETVHAIDITAPMKDSVMQGQPLFAPKPKPTPTFTVDQPGTLDRVIRILQDKAIDIKRIVESVQAAGLALPDELNPVLKEEMYMKRSEQRASDFTNDELRPLVKQMQLSKVTLEQLDQFLLARHIIDDKVNAHLQSINPDLEGTETYDRLAGMTDQEAQTILDGANAKVMNSLAKRVDAMVEKTRDLMVDYGLEKQSTIDTWRKTYQHYVPLHREGFEEEGHPTGTGRSVRGSTVKGRTGSGLAVTNILANVAQARDQIITRGEKQRPVIAMAGLLMLHPNPDIATLDKPAQIEMTDPQTGLITTVPGNLTNYTVPTVRRYDPVDKIVKTYPDPMYKGRDNVVNFRVEGQDYAIVFNERNERAMEAAKAFKELETPKLNGIMAAVAPYTRYLASINTQYNPIFGIVNFVRDAQFAMLALNSTPLAGMKAEVLRNARQSLRGIYQDARAVRLGRHPTSQTAQMWERFQHVGGPTGYRDLFFSSTDRGAEIERMLRPNDPSLITGPQALGKRLEETWLLQTLSDYNTTMENSIRLGVFTTAVQHGMSDIQAASYAKNITVNFNKKGQIGAQMGSLFAFFNANVQGTARIFETVFERTPTSVQLSSAGKKVVVGGILAGILQTFALAIAGFSDEEPPEYIKARNLVIPVPGTGKGYVLIPMPLGFNLLPNVGRAVAEGLRASLEGRDIEPLKRGANLIGAIYGTFSPLGGTGGPIQELLPTVADPIAAVVSNKDWTGKAISKEDMSSLDPTPGHTRTRDTASYWATFLSKGINWATGGTQYTPGVLSPTPDAIDYLIEQVTGGIGRELSKGSQVIQSAVTGEEIPFHKVPLLGRFAGSASGVTATRSTFYDNVKAVNLAYREFEGRAKDRTGDAHEYLRAHPEGRLREAAISIERTIGELNKVKKDLVEKGAPRAEIRLRETQITGLMNRFNQMVESQRKGAL